MNTAHRSLEASKSRVTRLGYAESVNISTTQGDTEDQLDVNVEVTERQTGSFQVGAGFSSVESFIFQRPNSAAEPLQRSKFEL